MTYLYVLSLFRYLIIFLTGVYVSQSGFLVVDQYSFTVY